MVVDAEFIKLFRIFIKQVVALLTLVYVLEQRTKIEKLLSLIKVRNLCFSLPTTQNILKIEWCIASASINIQWMYLHQYLHQLINVVLT